MDSKNDRERKERRMNSANVKDEHRAGLHTVKSSGMYQHVRIRSAALVLPPDAYGCLLPTAPGQGSLNIL